MIIYYFSNIQKNDIYVITNVLLSYDIVVMENDDKKQVIINLASRIKKLRKSKGLSQEDAYNDTGIHFSRIEQGKRDITYFTLYKICVYFDITLTDFFEDK